MTFSFAQVRYNQNGSSMSNTDDQSMVSGNAFRNYKAIIQLGIQAPPGTIFYINGSDNKMMIGSSGVFELDLLNKTSISGLRFDQKSIDLVQENDSAFIIVDILYAGEEV